MSGEGVSALLIHDDVCDRAYVYVDSVLALDVSKSEPEWRAAVAGVLDEADEAAESEGTVDRCGTPPEDLSGWTGLEPVERLDDDSLSAIIGIFGLGIMASIVFNAEYIFGEDIFFG